MENPPEKRKQQIERIDEFKQESNAHGDLGFAIADERIFYRELDEEDKWAKDLQDICYKHDGTTESDIAVLIGGCLSSPSHALADKGSPCTDWAYDSS